MTFLKRWKTAVQDAERGRGSADLWEGKQAYEDLHKAGFLEAALLAKRDRMSMDWRLRLAIEHIALQIRGYRDTQTKIVEMNSSYRQANDFLEQMSQRFEEEASKSGPGYVKEMLRGFAKDLLDSRRKLRRKYLEEFYQPWKPHRGVMVTILRGHKYTKRPDREDRLDTWFQPRIARILRLTFRKPGIEIVRRRITKRGSRKKVYERVPTKEPGISRRTIARLVVLTYIVSGLAKEKDGHLLIANTSKKLTVLSVEEKLQRAGIE